MTILLGGRLPWSCAWLLFAALALRAACLTDFFGALATVTGGAGRSGRFGVALPLAGTSSVAAGADAAFRRDAVDLFQVARR